MNGMLLLEAVAGTWNGITSTSLLEVFTETKDLIPIVGPAVVGFLGFRKAWGFLKGAIKGA